MRCGTWKVALLVVVVAIGGCDCEDRVRSILYGSSDDTPVTPLGDEDDSDGKQWEVTPNDSAADAMPIALSRDTPSVHGSIEPVDDVDWFALEVDDDEPWIVELTVEPTSPQLDVAIYLEVPGPGDYPPLMYDIADAGQAETIPMLGVSPERPMRFFVTGNGDATGDYRVDIRRRLTAASVAVAPNDHPHLAMTLPVPGEFQGFYDRPHDRDVFFIPAESLQSGVYTLELSAISGLEQTLYIYGDEALEQRLMEIPVGEREPAVIPNLSLQADRGKGLYFVLSAGEDFDREQGYRLRLIEHPDTDGFVLEREPNNTASTAQPIEFGEPIRGYLHTPSDVDRFRLQIGDVGDDPADEDDEGDDSRPALDAAGAAFDPEIEDQPEESDDRGEDWFDPWEAVPEKEQASHIVQARLRPLGDAHRLALRWHPEEGDGHGTQTLRADEFEEELILCNLVVDDGRYDLEVMSLESGDGFRMRDYDYELEVTNNAQIAELEIEPNDERDNADRLPMGDERIGFIATDGDVDVFAFVVGPDEPRQIGDVSEDNESESAEDSSLGMGGGWEAPQTENVRISLAGNALNLGFQLMDDEGGRVARVQESGRGGDEELVIDLPHGLYYVAVSASAGSLCEPYTISVATQ